MVLRKKSRRVIASSVLTAAMLVQTFAYGPFLKVARADSGIIIMDQMAAAGVHHQEIQYDNYKNTGKKQHFNIITTDLNNPYVQVITTKAKDVVIAGEAIPSQAQREIARGKNIVAGINGDMFNMTTGIPMGLQIKDGNLIINHNHDGQEKIFPSLAVDAANHVFIDEIRVDGNVSVDGNSFRIDMLNRNEHAVEKMALYTPILNSSSTLSWYVEGTNPQFYQNGAYAVITGIDNPRELKAGKTYTGQVVKLVSQTSSSDAERIPENGVIIAAFDTKADWIRNNLVEGKTVTFQFNIYRKDVVTNDIVQAVSSYNWLVKDGRALTAQELLNYGYWSSKVNGINAQTGIGLTADNKLVFMTIDKPSASYTGSDGTNLVELGIAMQEAGVITAIGMDSGGSTEIYVRDEGFFNIRTANYPSDGRSRADTNAIAVVSTAPVTGVVGKVMVDKSVCMITGYHSNFSTRATDTNQNPVDLAAREVTWNVTGGSFTAAGKTSISYTAPAAAGNYEITAAVDGVEGKANAYIVDSVDSIAFDDRGTLSIAGGQSKTLGFTATKNGMNVLMDANALEWSVSDPSIATVSNGVLTIASDLDPNRGPLTGTVTAKLGSTAAVLTFVTNLRNKLLDDIDSPESIDSRYDDSLKTYISSWDASVSTDVSRSGTHSIKVAYDYSGWNPAYNCGMPVYWRDRATNPQMRVDALPKKFGVYVYSDGSNYVPILKAYIRDGKNVQQQPTMYYIDERGQKITSGKLWWTGWRFFQVDIASSWTLPLKFEAIYTVDTDKTKIPLGANFKNTLYFDDPQFVFEDTPIDLDNRIAVNTAVFDKAAPEEVAIPFAVYKNTLQAVRVAGAAAAKDQDYTVQNSTLVLSENYLMGLVPESYPVVLDFTGGTDQTFTLTITSAYDTAGDMLIRLADPAVAIQPGQEEEIITAVGIYAQGIREAQWPQEGERRICNADTIIQSVSALADKLVETPELQAQLIWKAADILQAIIDVMNTHKVPVTVNALKQASTAAGITYTPDVVYSITGAVEGTSKLLDKTTNAQIRKSLADTSIRVLDAVVQAGPYFLEVSPVAVLADVVHCLGDLHARDASDVPDGLVADKILVLLPAVQQMLENRERTEAVNTADFISSILHLYAVYEGQSTGETIILETLALARQVVNTCGTSAANDVQSIQAAAAVAQEAAGVLNAVLAQIGTQIIPQVTLVPDSIHNGEGLTEAQQAVIAGKTAYRVAYAATQTNVTLSYTPDGIEDTRLLTAWLVHEDGTAVNAGGWYSNGTFSFTAIQAGVYFVTENRLQFRDLQGAEVYSPYMEVVTAKGWMSELEHNSFFPNKDVSGEMLRETLANVLHADPSALLADKVNAAVWSQKSITREELAVILNVALEAVEGWQAPVQLEQYLAYTDASKIAAEAQVAVARMTRCGIMSAKHQDKFIPQDKCTRAELAEIIFKWMQYLKR